MEVRVDELRKTTNSLLSYLEENNITKIDLEKDYYWNIPKESRYQVENEPNELTVGQLSED